MQFLSCGCSATTTHSGAHDGLLPNHPSCFSHDCCEVVEPPDLTGRQARCSEYGRPTGQGNMSSECRDCKDVCMHELPSSIHLPFFTYRPKKEFDEFYCGCHSWN